VTAENAPASAFLVLCLRKTDEKARKYTMFAEKVVQKAKPTEACGRRAGERLLGKHPQANIGFV